MGKTSSRRWLQFSLRSLFAAITILAVWLGINAEKVHKRSAMRDKIRQSGGYVLVDGGSKGPIFEGPLGPLANEYRSSYSFGCGNERNGGPSFVRRLLGDQYVMAVEVREIADRTTAEELFPEAVVNVELQRHPSMDEFIRMIQGSRGPSDDTNGTSGATLPASQEF